MGDPPREGSAGRWADCRGAAAKVTLAHAIVTSIGWNLWKGPQDSRSRALPNELVWCSAATKRQRLIDRLAARP